ncbi:MAG: hypothetical protein ACRDZ7_07085 [Acidimicrobiia bacterium]
MKRFLWCVVAGATAWGATFAAASQLPVTAGALGSGSVTPATCDPDGVTTRYVTGFDTTTGYTVTSVVVGGISASCEGRQVSVTVVKSGDHKLTTGGPGTVPAGGGTVTVALLSAVAVPTITRVHAVIS